MEEAGLIWYIIPIIAIICYAIYTNIKYRNRVLMSPKDKEAIEYHLEQIYKIKAKYNYRGI